MELLDKNLELLMQKLLEKDIHYVSENECQKSEIDYLIENGYFTKNDYSTFDGWKYEITPTQKGKYYFENKRKYIKAQQRKIAIQWIRFVIPVIISIGALAVSVIALCK